MENNKDASNYDGGKTWFCTQCGKPNNPAAKFCTGCGTKKKVYVIQQDQTSRVKGIAGQATIRVTQAAI